MAAASAPSGGVRRTSLLTWPLISSAGAALALVLLLVATCSASSAAVRGRELGRVLRTGTLDESKSGVGRATSFTGERRDSSPGHPRLTQTRRADAAGRWVTSAGEQMHLVHRRLQQASADPVAYQVTSWGDATPATGLGAQNAAGGVRSLDGGYEHIVVLRADGSVATFGAASSEALSAVPEVLTSPGSARLVSGGGNHSVAIQADSYGLVAWGANSSGQAAVPAAAAAGGVGCSTASGGAAHTLALLRNGTVIAFGDNTAGQATVPTAAAASVRAVAAGADHSLALLTSGSVVAWGAQGTGAAVQVPTPALSGVVAIAAGDGFSMALKQDGSVVVWGEAGSLVVSGTPAKVSSGNVTAIAAGAAHALALLSSGEVVAWGDSTRNQTALPETATSGVSAIATADYSSFALISTNSSSAGAGLELYSWGLAQRGIVDGVKAVTGGREHSIALFEDGSVEAWGLNYDGPLNIPADLTGVVAVAAGGDHSLALLADGTVRAWGRQEDGITDVPASLQAGGVGASAVYAGSEHSLALLKDGNVVAWGGPNAFDELNIPASVLAGGVTAVSTLARHSLALLADGSLVTWGGRSDDNLTVPTTLVRGTIQEVRACGAHSLVLLKDGNIVTWGSNEFGAMDVPALVRSSTVVDIACGFRYSMALLEDGTLQAWGSDEYGDPLQLPDDLLSSVVQISSGWYTLFTLKQATPEPPLPPVAPAPPSPPALVGAGLGTYNATAFGFQSDLVPTSGVLQLCFGYSHGVAVMLNGSVRAWGLNDLGQTKIPTADLSGHTVSAVACGANHTLALLEDGRVVGWGNDNFSQATPPTELLSGTERAIAVAAGAEHSLALMADGSIRAWGSNNFGQINVPASASSGVTAIATAYNTNLALVNGGVVAWGDDLLGEATVPAEAQQGVRAIACAGAASFALLNSGRVVAWGGVQDLGNMPDVVDATGVVQIAAGSMHVLVLLDDGTVQAYGDDTEGQSSIPAKAASQGDSIAAGWVTSAVLRAVALPPSPPVPSPSPTPPGAVAPSPPPPGGALIPVPGIDTQSTRSSTPIGAIVGGAVGGAAALAIVVAVAMLLWCRRRKACYARAAALPPGEDKEKGEDIIKPPPGSGFPAASCSGSDGASTVAVLDHVHAAMGTGPPAANKVWMPVGSQGVAAAAAAGPSHHPTGSNGFGFPGKPAPPHWGPISPGGPSEGYLAASSAAGGATGSHGAPPAVPPSVQFSSHGEVSSHAPGTATGTATGSEQTNGTRSSMFPTGGVALQSPDGSGLDVTAVMQSRIIENLDIAWAAVSVGGQLGEGGFGKVYKGMWRGNRVAVKMLDMDANADHLRTMLHQEALIMCQLHHPSVARVYGVVDEGPYQALVMQYYRRGSLARAMSTIWYQDLGEADRLSLALQVAGGMLFLHQRQPCAVIHGDLKTSNLLLEDDGQKVVIADFGLACWLHLPNASAAAGAMTASISPPEVHMDPTAPRGPATDVYAFAVVLLEILMGQPPFHGMSSSAIREMVVRGGRPDIPESLPVSVRSLVTECWAQDPAARPSFEAITTRLEDALAEARDGWNTTTTLVANNWA